MIGSSRVLWSFGSLFGIAFVSGCTGFARDVGVSRSNGSSQFYNVNRKIDSNSELGRGSDFLFEEKADVPKRFNYGKDKLIHRVRSGADLVFALSKGTRCEDEPLRVELLNDITLSSDLKLPNNTVINLKGYTIEVTPDATITIGTKTLVSRTPYKVWHEGKDVWRHKVVYAPNLNGGIRSFTEYYKEHIPGYYETKFEDVFSYDDKVNAKIINGRIIGQKCKNMDSTKDAYWYSEAHGKVGNSKRSVIDVLSGNLIVGNLYISGHDGGDGGDATYSDLWHIPFGGGDGGNGGTGGKGSNVFYVEVGHGKVLNEGRCIFRPGRGGAGGKGSDPNPEYWLWSGSSGKNGSSGQSGEVINNPGSLMK